MFEPFGNTTVLPPTQWHPEPQFRGTFSILSSCLITMSLCIWTSLHLNLPEHKKEHLQKYRKLGWMALGLLAPELVVWNAWEQRKQSRELSALMIKKGFMPERLSIWKRTRKWIATIRRETRIFLLLEAGDLPESADPKPYKRFNGHVHAWTDVHSWLVVMGGMAFEDLSPEDKQFMPGKRQRTVLTLKGFMWIVKHRPHLIPDISLEHIQDKSKSDWLAKGLTCWQAGYFCIQCVFRLSQQLSITLLELNVFAHAICALLLFLIWWDKPRDIQEPTLLVDEESLDICACFLKTQAEYVGYSLILELPYDVPTTDRCLEVSRPTTISAQLFSNDCSDMFVTRGLQRFEFLTVGSTHWELRCYGYRLIETSPLGYLFQVTGRDFARLLRVSKALEADSGVSSLLRHVLRSLTHSRISNWTGSLFDRIPETWSELSSSNNVWFVAGATFAGACYGGLHLTAWANQFPSYTESVIWRAASVTILATGSVIAIIHVIKCSANSIQCPYIDSNHRYMMLIIDEMFFKFAISVIVLLLLWYMLCRTFIVVECFILLAHIPESALRVPIWAAYVPSFS